jgi:membrane protein DedA with SNARE-associated domain
LDRYGYAAVFVTVLVEGFGIPAPGQTLLTVAALMAAQGKLDIVTLIAIAWSATVIGNLFGYAIGAGAFYLQRDFHAIAGVFVRFGPYAWLVAIGVLLLLLIYLRRRRQQDQTC